MARITLKKPYDLGNGIELISYGINSNGNHSMTIMLSNGSKKTIQTNTTGLFDTHSILRGAFKDMRDDELERVSSEVKAYVKKYFESKQFKKIILSENIKGVGKKGDIVYKEFYSNNGNTLEFFK